MIREGLRGGFGDDDVSLVALDPANALPRRLAARAREHPSAPFLVEADHGRSATYGQFWDEARRWASLLRSHGVRAGDRVATMLPSSIDACAVWVGASLIGAYEVPINPQLRGSFLEHVLDDAGVAVAVTRPEHAALLRDTLYAHRSALEHVEAPISGLATSGVEPIELGDLPTPESVSCVIYTSGTTGPAKGVVISWAQMAAIIGRIPRSMLSSEDAAYAPWPMFHVTGRSPLISMADVGGRVVLRERFDADSFWSDIQAFGCTTTTAAAVVPLLLGHPASADDADNPLRIVLLGRPGRDGLRFLERFNTAGMCFYGSTEVGFPIGNQTVSADTADIVGWPRPGYETRVVDEAGRAVPDGTVGKLWVKPPDRRLMMIGYLGQPERTERATADGWYHTGDAVERHADGSILFVDRMGDTIRRFGENISTTALEEVVRQDLEVLECAVFGVKSPVTGHDVAVAAVPAPGCDLDPAALAARLCERLPRYMCPAHVAVVDALPKTPNGKVRKVGLDALLAGERVWQSRREA